MAILPKMTYECKDCGASLELPEDAQNGEIIECEDCGLDYIVKLDGAGSILLMELAIEGEDWGE